MKRLVIGEVLVRNESDIVLARQNVKQLANMAGLSLQDQTRLITASSEILRNAFQYAGGARVELAIVEDQCNQYVEVAIRDKGTGIANLDKVLQGEQRSKTGMGVGIPGARKLVDNFSIESSPNSGTFISLAKLIPADLAAVTDSVVEDWAKQLKIETPGDIWEELQEQNKQLLQALDEAQKYKLEVERQLQHVKQLNQDLEQTNKGIMALYKELDERSTMLEQQGEQLQLATRHKSEFLANMSHEIRTPMNGVLGMTEVLLKSGLTDKQREYANTIREAGKSLLSIINDILDFSKIEAGKLSLDIGDFEPVRLVEDIAELLSAQARQRGLSLLTFIDPELPLVLRGDAGRIRQILINFVGNAVKFSEHGTILIRATLEVKNNKSATVKFVVTDPGIGLNDEEIQSLFEPFSQGDTSNTRKYGGTGLGLSISKRLVQLMGGKIGVSSVKGHGSTFWFCLPLEIGRQRHAEQLTSSNLSGLKVLVVDDDAAAAEIIATYVSCWGMRPSAMCSAKEALSELQAVLGSDPYNLVLVDLVMPEIGGMQLAKIIREDKSLADLKLILITAFDKPGVGEEAIQLGYDAYLTKPIRQSRLFNAIATVLHKSEQEPKSARADEKVAVCFTANNRASRPELILVAEDHLINQQVALLLLRDMGFEAHIAENGCKVIETFQRSKYSLIFMDCQMPEMDGFEATRQLRKLEATTGRRTPIIAMTAHAIEGSREQCLAAGMDDYISKPIEEGQLLDILGKWLPSSTQANNVGLAIDMNTVRHKYREYTGQLIDLFLSDAPSLIEQLEKSIASNDTIETFRIAHGLKGICSTMHVGPMRQLCVDIESCLHKSELHDLPNLLNQLKIELQQLKEFLNQIGDSN